MCTRRERTCITKNRCRFLSLLGTALLSVVFSAQPAFGADGREMVPARLDFDATRAPTNCNDLISFRGILGAWVPDKVLRPDAERRLIVRIRWTSAGGKRADVSLVDAQGVTLAERHTSYAAKTECHKVLWTVAHDAAEILGAFDPPPPKDPITCPACPLCAFVPPARPCPTCPVLLPPAPIITLTPTLYRSSIGFGGVVAAGIYSKLSFGSNLMLGFVPSRHLPDMHIEFEGGWTSQSSQSIRLQSIPLVQSLCLVRGNVRFCGGMATTFLYSNQTAYNDDLRLMFGGNFRVGTELLVRGPLSIRVDVFGRFVLSERRFGQAMMALEDPAPITAGLAIMGAWSFE